MATNGNINHVEQQFTSSSGEQTAQTTTSDLTNNSSKADLPKDEVGWYFVEQYYTTLSKNPDKLHLFYGKKSQFVNGPEAEVADVAAGRPAIQEAIKKLKFQDCKVRISNVDSQGSGENIVIQVIGETSNNGEEPKKFVQTFILAQQPSGYFVLNDILRYINDFGDEEVAEPEQPAAEPAETVPEPETEVEAQPEPAVVEEAPQQEQPAALDTDVIDKKLEEVEAPVEEEAPAPVEPTAEAAPVPAKEEPVSESLPDPEKAADEVAEEDAKKPEDPKAPTPTPAPVPVPRVATPVAAEPEKPKEPPKPMSWASRVAAAAGPRAAVPTPKVATPSAPVQPRPAAPAAAKPQPAPATPAAENTPPSTTSQDQGNEWQTAETKRQNRTQSQAATAPEKDTTMAYIKYVTEKVKDEDLRSALAAFGELVYFDINRSKNCAFVEFKNQAGYNAAVAANPHSVNGESIVVEQRRPKANAFGGTNFSSNTRGGSTGRGRGFEPGRTGSQGGRGGFPGQPRGGRGGAPRGRGGAQGATA